MVKYCIIMSEVKIVERKFIITPKYDRVVTLTLRISSEMNQKLEALSAQSGRSRNDLINQALEYAMEDVEFSDTMNGEME